MINKKRLAQKLKKISQAVSKALKDKAAFIKKVLKKPSPPSLKKFLADKKASRKKGCNCDHCDCEDA